MHIEWHITKERGNLRPVLSYRVRLEEHEKALALPSVSVLSTIPRPEEHHMKHCYPGTMERRAGWKADAFYTLEAPGHMGHSPLNTLTLPWRENNAYPEVEESFGMLRDALEEETRRACASAPMDVQGSVGATLAGKRRVAPDAAAVRFLRLARNRAESA